MQIFHIDLSIPPQRAVTNADVKKNQAACRFL